MYKITVPVNNGNLKRNNRERTLEELRKFDAERVLLALDRYELEPDKRRRVISELEDNCRFFRENGFEVGAWIWTFWVKDNKNFKNMRSINGTEIKEFMCPKDENFVKFAADYIKDIAKTGVDIIQFDDDFRYGFLSDSPACLCDNHIAEINRITGENSTREELAKHIVSGGKNKYRDAYLKANGDAFRNFAAEIRKAVDEVNPNIRIGACSCMTSWDIDGTNAAELAKILAGNTQPFVRLIGAPYWAVSQSWGNSLQDVVELERMESSWTRKDNIEIFAEGDAYPRPRTRCPASYLEGFDTAIRASGCTDGILKYGIDYISNADYETGYARFHERNRGIYGRIDEMFGDKTCCGVRVYESMNKLSDMVMPTAVNGSVNIENLFFSKAARTLAYNAIPTVYEGKGVCGIVFDENARNLPLEALENGLIIDIAAAEILAARGIDVGIETFGAEISSGTPLDDGGCERFINNNNHILTDGIPIYDIKLKSNAEILSDTKTSAGVIPMSYRYENSDGNRFLVLNVNTRSGASNVLKHYARSKQYAENIPWLSGNKLPAYVYGNPALYIIAKKNDSSMAVGLWNFFADTAIDPVVELDGEYSGIEFLNTNGKLDKNKVYLSNIPPFGFVGFEVKI